MWDHRSQTEKWHAAKSELAVRVVRCERTFGGKITIVPIIPLIPFILPTSKESGLIAAGGFEPKFFVTQFGRDAALRGALEITLHNQIGFVDFFQRVGLFANGHGQ